MNYKPIQNDFASEYFSLRSLRTFPMSNCCKSTIFLSQFFQKLISVEFFLCISFSSPFLCMIFHLIFILFPFVRFYSSVLLGNFQTIPHLIQAFHEICLYLLFQVLLECYRFLSCTQLNSPSFRVCLCANIDSLLFAGS